MLVALDVIDHVTSLVPHWLARQRRRNSGGKWLELVARVAFPAGLVGKPRSASKRYGPHRSALSEPALRRSKTGRTGGTAA
jgi:hypothetical protein